MPYAATRSQAHALRGNQSKIGIPVIWRFPGYCWRGNPSIGTERLIFAGRIADQLLETTSNQQNASFAAK